MMARRSHAYDHHQCQCGHMGWRHRDDRTCTRCDCQRFHQSPIPEAPSGKLEPRRNTQRHHRAA